MATDLLTQLQDILGEAYRVERELGGAGMSRVFLVKDVELDRQVVVKVLPPDLAAGLNVDRFRREIQLAAKLQHPHIVQLISAGARGGLLYYTMPFIAGENLRARLVRLRELPVSDATRILREVADALEYAHSQGVVHRDIKPENILFSGSHALVTDFGVSKALSSATAETRVDGTPQLTSLGIALGTPTYMAPEQAAADPHVDHRADIYSLGVVGYEILTGRPPFTGMTPQATLSAQVTMNPDPVTNHRPNLPPALAAAIMRCLEKHPSDRWQTAAELRTQLETIFTPSGATQPVAARPPFRWTPQRMMIAAAVAGVLIAGVFLSTIAFKKDDAGFVIANTRQVTNAPGLEMYPAISPDGKMVAYATIVAGKPQIFVRQVDAGRAVQLTSDTLGSAFPKWKPDGSVVTFSNALGVYSIPPLGGSPTAVLVATPQADYKLCEWSPQGTRIACTNMADGAIYILGPSGDKPRRITDKTGDPAHSLSWSPNGKRIAYVMGNVQFILPGPALGNLAASSIWVVDVAGGSPKRITESAHLNMSPVWTPDGDHVLFVSSLGGVRDIYSQRVNGDGAPAGSPVRLTTGLKPHSISLSQDGRFLAYSAFTTSANIWSAAIDGTRNVDPATIQPVTRGNQTIEGMDVSPDGKWLAYDSDLNGNTDIYKMPLPAGDPIQLTHNPANDFAPQWSPDGSEIVFHSFRNGTRDIFIISADGSKTTPVFVGPGQELVPTWSPDGKQIGFYRYPDTMLVVTRTPSGWTAPKNLLGTATAIPNGGGMRWSPDGKFIAFQQAKGIAIASTEDGSIRPFAPTQVSIGTPSAIWSKDSKLLYYPTFNPDGTGSIWVGAVSGGSATQILHLTDPLRQFYRPLMALDGKRIYFTIGTRESDVWVMELNRK